MEERSDPGPDASYHTGDTEGAGDNLTGHNLRGFALMISKLLFSLAQL